jgi:hypothetical protein
MLAHELAARGGRSVRELLSSIDAQEWLDWQAFDEVSPVGDARIERMLAVLCTLVANQWRGKDDDPARLADMLPDHGGLRAEAEARRRRSKSWRKKKLAELRAGFLRK